MKKLLVTGGSGFIGTNLIDFFSKTNCAILNIDLNPPKIIAQRTYWQKADLCDFEIISPVIRSFSPDVVIHLAARTDLGGQSLSDYKANIDGVVNLLSILDNISGLKKVIFTSSMYVCKPGYVPKNAEDYKPHTIYGESKVLTEQLIKNRSPDYSWSIIRPTSIWGPHFGEPYNLFFNLILLKKYFHLGKKACKKTYGYIENTISQIDAIIRSPDNVTNKKVFYLGDYNPYDITEWADEIASCINTKIITIPYFLFLAAAKTGDILTKLKIKFPMTSFRLQNMTTDNVCDLDLIKSIAPSLPVSRSEGINKTVSWMKKNIHTK